MSYYLGIDGGGTKTTAVVANETGKIICRAVGKTLNFYAVCIEACRDNLKNLMAEIEKECGISSFDAVAIGCSALDCKADEETVNSLCANIIHSPKIYMDSDAFIALAASNASCVAICGTGSIAIGEKSNGEIVVTGGWGHILGDEGSAYMIAISALKLCCTLCDDGADHPILKKALEYFEIDDFRGAIDIIYSLNTSKDYIAGFAAQVGALAQQGCSDAQNILKKQAVAFAKTVYSLINAIDSCTLLSVYGGVFKNSELFREEFTKAIQKEYPIPVELLTLTPEEGAIKVAMEL